MVFGDKRPKTDNQPERISLSLNMNLKLLLRLFTLVVLLVSTVSMIAAAPLMPLEKRMRWIYEGKVELQDGSETKSKTISLTTEILDVFTFGRARLAVVSGFPTELAWYNESEHPGYSLIIVTEANIYQRRTETKAEAYRLARAYGKNPKSVARDAEALIFSPMSERECGLSSVKGYTPSGKMKCELSEHRTNPDLETFEFVRGLGIVSYHYRHFGSVSLADVDLKEVRFP